ncbi:MAG: helix-turn-helix domain-containing protein [Clostridia bacterium]|nr:helix-turn-helix domain-containing protein [Clostridia bacterium]
MKIQYETRVVDLSIRDASVVGGTLTVGPHLHKHIEIVYMISGSTRAVIDTETYTVNAGDLLVVFPNKIHSFADLESGIKYVLFIVDPYAIPELSQKFLTMDADSALIKGASQNQRLDSLVGMLADYENFPAEQRDLLIRGYLLSFCAEFIGMMDLGRARSDENMTIKSIVAYCSQNFTKELSLSVLEKELHLSKYYISHLFGDILNVRFTDYINSLRISEACRLLRTTDHSVTEVASLAGFGTLRTFNRAFISRMGTSPSVYRKSNATKDGEPTDIYVI